MDRCGLLVLPRCVAQVYRECRERTVPLWLCKVAVYKWMQDGCESRCGSDGVVDRGPTCALSCADGNSVATGRLRVSGRPSISCTKLI